MGVYLATGAVLVAYLALSWLLGAWLNLEGSDLWFLRGGLALLGLLGAASFLWFYHRLPKDAPNPAGDLGGGSTADIDLLVNDAAERLRTSKLGGGASLGKLPVVFLLGESGSIKTSTIVNSGLDPELLAGQAFEDKQVLPTRMVNFWYTRQAVFADTSGDLLRQPALWTRLIKLLEPGRLSSAVSAEQQAPRAAVVCYSCENFFRSGASQQTTAAARKIGARLQDISRLLGINFPLYVLFTKLDCVPFFADYTRNLNPDEAGEVLGVTLPVLPAQAGGVYAEEESRRLTKAFDELFYSLAEKRLDFLSREQESERLPGVYEFPRELRKMRSLLTQFLVDLARPSQLQSNPFLRGFYFSGVRPVVLDDVAPAPLAAAAIQTPDPGATRIFSARDAQPRASAPTAGSRKVPQWAFLPRLFSDVLLKDKVALSASGQSARVNRVRRAALGVAILICSLLCLAFLVSFLGNRSLENEVEEAAREAPQTQFGPGQLAPVSDLEKLDRLRQSVARLTEYREGGPPFYLRWGLYVGDRLYPAAREAYFGRFRQLMFGATEAQLLSYLRGLPDSPGPGDVYENAYNALKAYLITTSNHERSTPSFLSPVLLGYWRGGRDVEPGEIDLAKQQFDFYSSELVRENPYSSSNDPRIVGRVRFYLSKFAGIDRYYLPLLAEAGRSNPSVSFSRRFKDAADVVVNRYEVKGAFTKGGFAFMEGALRQPSRFLTSEEWVVGPATAETLDAARLEQQLSDRYHRDFVTEWRNMLKSTTVVGYANLHDAEAKLGKLAGPGSPLLELFWFVSQNTDVDLPQIKNAFQPVQSLEPPGSPADKFIQSGDESYVSALTSLQSAIGLLASSPSGTGDVGLVNQTLGAATEGEKAVGQLAEKFLVDPQFHIETLTQDLLGAPLRHAEALIKLGPTDALNAAGRQFCGQFAALSRFYPFNPTSSSDLPLPQFTQMFAPGTGALWTFYDSKLKTFLVKQGSQYVPQSSGSAALSPAFASFFNRASRISEVFFPSGALSPRFSYTLTQLPSNVEGLMLRTGGETLSGTGQSKTFTWTGAEDVQVSSKGGDILGSYSGPWAVFHFVADAHVNAAGPATDLEWILQNNGRTIMLPNGRPKSYSYELRVSGFNPLRPGELSAIRCVLPLAH